jgi:hypothetical protein
VRWLRIALTMIEDGRPGKEFAAKLFAVPPDWHYVQGVDTRVTGESGDGARFQVLGPKFEMRP